MTRFPGRSLSKRDNAFSAHADITAILKEEVLAELRIHGVWSRAAKRAGVPLSTLYKWRKIDPLFLEDAQEARDMAADLAEDTVQMLMLTGKSESVRLEAAKFQLKHIRPETYAVKHVDHSHTLEWKSNIPERARPVDASTDRVIDVDGRAVEE
jgi:hypothetical protein